MKVGDLVKDGRDIGLIVDVDPLRRGRPMPAGVPIGEIVVLLGDGVFWHCRPDRWEVVHDPTPTISVSNKSR